MAEGGQHPLGRLEKLVKKDAELRRDEVRGSGKYSPMSAERKRLNQSINGAAIRAGLLGFEDAEIIRTVSEAPDKDTPTEFTPLKEERKAKLKVKHTPESNLNIYAEHYEGRKGVRVTHTKNDEGGSDVIVRGREEDIKHVVKDLQATDEFAGELQTPKMKKQIHKIVKGFSEDIAWQEREKRNPGDSNRN